MNTDHPPPPTSLTPAHLVAVRVLSIMPEDMSRDRCKEDLNAAARSLAFKAIAWAVAAGILVAVSWTETREQLKALLTGGVPMLCVGVAILLGKIVFSALSRGRAGAKSRFFIPEKVTKIFRRTGEAASLMLGSVAVAVLSAIAGSAIATALSGKESASTGAAMGAAAWAALLVLAGAGWVLCKLPRFIVAPIMLLIVFTLFSPVAAAVLAVCYCISCMIEDGTKNTEQKIKALSTEVERLRADIHNRPQ